MALDFEKFAMKGNEFINTLAGKLGDEHDRDRAARVLRCVVRALREKLSIEDNLELLHHLPMAIKGAYIDGWKMNSDLHYTDSLEDLVAEIMKHDGLMAKRDFKTEEEAVIALRAVIETMAVHVEPSEAMDFEVT